MSLYLYRQFFWAKITPFLKYILAEYHFWYSNARFRTVVRENRGFGAAVGLPSTPGRKLLRMQSVGLPPWRESLSGAVMRGYFKENNHRGFGSPSSVTHGFTARGTFPAAGEGSGWRQPKGFPLAGQEAPGKSQMLGFFSRVPDALAASGSCRLNGVKTTDEGIHYYCSLYDS